METKVFLFLTIIGVVILSHHQSSGHVIGIDKIKGTGVAALSAVKLASGKVGAAVAVPFGLAKEKAALAVKVPVALAKKKVGALIALKKAKIVAPVVLLKAAKTAIATKIVEKKLKLAALKLALEKNIALAKVLKLAKIPLFLWKLKLPIIALKKAIKALEKKKVFALEAIKSAAKLSGLKTLGTKGVLAPKLGALPQNLGALVKPLAIPFPAPFPAPISFGNKETDFGLSALLSGGLPLIGSAANIEKPQLPEILYQFIPDYSSQYKNIQLIPKPAIAIPQATAEVVFDAPNSSSLFDDLPETFQPPAAEPPSVYGIPNDSYSLPRL